jgi:hypothetical protein
LIAVPLQQRLERHEHGPFVIDDQDMTVICFHSIALLVLRTIRSLQLLKRREMTDVSSFF